MVNKIKFSHDYVKLYKINKDVDVTLIQVCYHEDLFGFSKEFLNYDTQYFKKGQRFNYYLNPEKAHILLFFEDYNGMLFITIRPYSPIKIEYYRNQVGKLFRVEIKKDQE